MRTLVLGPAAGSVGDAVARSAGLLALARAERAVVLTACALDPGPMVLLGALQRAGRVLDVGGARAAGVPVLRRSTTGTGFFLDGGLLISLAVPYLDAIFADTSPRTFLNRNVRPIMRGLEAVGLSCAYFGREWLAWRGAAEQRGRALAVLGFELEPDGAALFEAYLTERGSFVIPPEHATDLERSCDRYRGRPPVSVSEASQRGLDLEALLAAMVERVGLQPARLPADASALDARRAAQEVTRSDDPLPPEAELFEPQPIPAGFLDRARVGAESWVGGDLLAPTFALGLSASWRDGALPMEGAVWADVRRADDMTQHHFGLRRR